MSKSKNKHVGVDLIDAPQKFWPQLFPNQQTFQKCVGTWVEKWMSGTKQEAFNLSAVLPAKWIVADIEIIADKSKTTLLIAGKTLSAAPLYRDIISPPYNPQWSIENPLKKIENSFAQAHEYNQIAVMAMFDYASYLAGRQLSSAIDTALKSGLLIMSGTKISDPFAENVDVASDRIGEFRLDMLNNRACWNATQAPVLSNIIVRLGSPTKDRSGGQSFTAEDDILVEKMRMFIGSKMAKNVTDAARQVAPEALRLGGLESVERRLRNAYGLRYPTRVKR